MAPSLSNTELRDLKARAQRLEPAVRLGREGATEAFFRALEDALVLHALVKVKFTEHKEEKKTLAPQIAERTGSRLIMRVGNVAVYYRPKAPAPAKAESAA